MGYKNYTGSYKGYMTVREAIRVSQNLPMIRALREVGVDKAYEFGKKLGLPLVEITADTEIFTEMGNVVKQEKLQKKIYVLKNQIISRLVFYEKVGYEEDIFLSEDKELRIVFDHTDKEILYISKAGEEITLEEFVY